MNARAARWIAWFLVAAYVILAAVGIALQAITNTPYASAALPVTIILVVLASGWLGAGALIISRHPQHPVGWLLCAGLFFPALDMFAAGYAAYDTYALSGSLPGVDLALVWLKLGNFAPLGLAAFTLIILLFPDGRFLSPGWRRVAWTTVAALLFFLPLQALEPGSADPLFLQLRTNPLGVSPSLWAVLKPLMWTAFSILLLCYGAAFVSLLVRLRNSQGDVRQQIKWLCFPAGLFGIFWPLFIFGMAEADEVILGISFALGQVAVAGIVIAIAFAIFRYRLYDIDLILNRTLVYGALTACVIGLYVLVVGGLGIVFQAQGNLLIAVLATGLVAVLFQPLRERLQRGVNRLLYGERDDPYTVLARLGRQLETTLAPDAVLPAIVETIAQALKLPYAAIALKQADDSTTTAASYGLPGAESVRLPLIYQSENIGQLILSPRAPDEPFTPAEQRLLEDIAHQTSVAAHAARLTNDLRRTAAELQRSRERLITTREEERRRLRRDLHDGLGPALAAQTLKVGAARALLAHNPEAANQLLADLESDIQAALSDIRRLVYDLRPPELDELGLVGAIRASAAQYGAPRDAAVGRANGTTPHISVEAPEKLPPLPAAAEVAAYRIAQEALANVVRHAHARTCCVRLALDDGLHLTISDDGVGLPAERRAGVGLASMRERAEELGGSCVIERASGGGTRVVVQLPLVDAS